ncbi:MAG TPA: hypothetical protein VK918_01490 [Pyrinomonadaceae bacterium]|nr:hypothetical protein [Pyrinomonadaceae bacterium]
MFFVGSIASCGDDPIANENAAPTPAANRSPEPEKSSNDSAEELGLLITLPYEPAEVAWRDTEAGPAANAAPGNSLRAAILFGPENAQLIEDELKTIDPGTNVEILSEEWFPAELVAKSELGEESKLQGTAYPAGPFLKAPYSEGRAVRITETDYFVVELKKP